MKEAVQDFFEECFREFLSSEKDNIEKGISERNLCGRLALIMELRKEKYGLAKYYADIEYNRKQEGKLKTIINDKFKIITIVCDLILHSRGESIIRDNIIAIEMKKTGSQKSEKENDLIRLRAMTKSSFDDLWSNDGIAHPEHVCGYELGVFIELDKARNRYQLEYFRKGKAEEISKGSF